MRIGLLRELGAYWEWVSKKSASGLPLAVRALAAGLLAEDNRTGPLRDAASAVLSSRLGRNAWAAAVLLFQWNSSFASAYAASIRLTSTATRPTIYCRTARGVAWAG